MPPAMPYAITLMLPRHDITRAMAPRRYAIRFMLYAAMPLPYFQPLLPRAPAIMMPHTHAAAATLYADIA